MTTKTLTQTNEKSISLQPAALGALLAMLGVALGAFGAHALENVVTPERLETFETGVRYQMYHALALLIIGALSVKNIWVNWLIFSGVLVFSGSLYILVLTDTGWLGAITPIGGVLMLAGWLVLFFSLIRKS